MCLVDLIEKHIFLFNFCLCFCFSLSICFSLSPSLCLCVSLSFSVCPSYFIPQHRRIRWSSLLLFLKFPLPPTVPSPSMILVWFILVLKYCDFQFYSGKLVSQVPDSERCPASRTLLDERKSEHIVFLDEGSQLICIVQWQSYLMLQ